MSIRVPKGLKRDMERLKDMVDWKEEIVTFLKERVDHYSKLKALMEIRKVLEAHPVLPEGSALRSVREDRDDR